MIKFFLRDENGYEQAESVCIKYIANPLLSIIENDNSDIVIAPNPASEYITVNLSSINPTPKRGVEDESLIEIYDVMGVKIRTELIHPMFPKHRMYVGNLAPGVYFIKVICNNGACSIVEKFVKY